MLGKKSRRYAKILFDRNQSKREFGKMTPMMAREVRKCLKEDGYKNLPSTRYRLQRFWDSSISDTRKTDFYRKKMARSVI
jgi:hypothetical protein